MADEWLQAQLAPQEVGSTWSSPTVQPATSPANWGLGGDQSSQGVGEFHIEGALPAMCTLTLGLSILSPDPSVANPLFGFIMANLIIGNGAAGYNFSMDWAHGSAITIPTGSVTVQAKQIGTINYKVKLSASLALGTRGGYIPPTFTYHETLPAGAAAQFVLVPERARTLIVPRTQPAATADVSIVVLRGTGGAGALVGEFSHAVASDQAIWTTGVMLPPDAYFVGCSSVIGVPLDRQEVIFGLSG
jgi:hypothetical protein